MMRRQSLLHLKLRARLTAVPGRAAVDRGPAATGVPRHVRRPPHRAQFVDEVPSIVGLVGAERDRARPVGPGLDHVQGCHALDIIWCTT